MPNSEKTLKNDFKITKMALIQHYSTLFNIIQHLEMYLISYQKEIAYLIKPDLVPENQNQSRKTLKFFFNEVKVPF